MKGDRRATRSGRLPQLTRQNLARDVGKLHAVAWFWMLETDVATVEARASHSASVLAARPDPRVNASLVMALVLATPSRKRGHASKNAVTTNTAPSQPCDI